MEEPRPGPVGRPRKDAPKRPVQRVYRMAYCATITFHDEAGAALHTIRQGAVPNVEPVDLCDRLLADAVAILQQRPDLHVVRLSDGAPEMRNLLARPSTRRRWARRSTNCSTSGTSWRNWPGRASRLRRGGRRRGAAPLAGGPAQRNAAPDDILAALRESGREHVASGGPTVHEPSPTWSTIVSCLLSGHGGGACPSGWCD